MNRTDRLYAMVEELRAVAPRTRTARWLARRFEISTRTVERDIGALQQSGVPIYAQTGRGGGYTLDRSRTLPPVNVTSGEALAVAVALHGLAGTPFYDAGRSGSVTILDQAVYEDRTGTTERCTVSAGQQCALWTEAGESNAIQRASTPRNRRVCETGLSPSGVWGM